MSVLVVGGGLSGLSTAMFMALHGAPPLLVERHPTTSVHPKARGQFPRWRDAMTIEMRARRELRLPVEPDDPRPPRLTGGRARA